MQKRDDDQQTGSGILHPEGMQATRDLATGLVHEINNLLGVIIGNVHLAMKSGADSTSLEKYLGEVRAAAEQGKELMRDLANLSARDTQPGRPLALNDLVGNVVSDVDAAVTLDLSGEDPVAKLNLWLAKQALTGALRFMSESTSVSRVRVATRVVGAAVALTLEDDGVSPTEEDLRRLFTPFAKIERRPNTQLALTNLADLASRSGGYVSGGVREPHGLRLVLTLPVANAPSSGDGPGVPLAE